MPGPLIIRSTGVQEYLDATGEAHVKALILGAPSAGKTRSASFWPKPIFADCEKGRMSIADRAVPYAEVNTRADMDALLRRVEVECKKPPGQRAWQTFVLDTIDSYQRIVTQERLRSERKEALSGFADWGFLDSQMTALIARLVALPMNIVVNSHIKETKDGDDGPIVFQPKLKGDIREQIAAEFDLVGWMNTHWEIENTPSGDQKVLTRTVQWYPEPRFMILKDRSGQLPRETPVSFSDADYYGLFSTMFGEHLENLTDSEVLEEVERPVETVVPDPKAGPVAAAKRATAAKKAAAAAPKAEQGQQSMKGSIPVGVPPAKRAAAEVTVTETPAAEPAVEPAVGADSAPAEEQPADGGPAEERKPTSVDVPFSDAGGTENAAQAPETGIQTAEQVLGATVISEPEAAEDKEVEQAGDTPAAPTTAASGVVCGTPARSLPDGQEPAKGCGKDLAGESPDMVNIAILKTKTRLCPACLAAWRAEHEKKAG